MLEAADRLIAERDPRAVTMVDIARAAVSDAPRSTGATRPRPRLRRVALLDEHERAETGQFRLATGAYQFWRAHVRALVRQAGIGDPDAPADLLLAPLAPEVYRHQRGVAGLSKCRIADALALMAECLLGEDRPRPRRGRGTPGPGQAPVRQQRVKRT